MSELKPISPIIKVMINQNRHFLDRWLEATISSKDVRDHIKNQDLNLWRDIGGRISEGSHKAYQEALGSGLPPLPDAASHFRNICFRQEQENDPLFPRHGTSFWENLEGACYDYVTLSFSDTAFRQGLNEIHCKHLTLENMVGDWSFEDMPKLGIEGELSVLQIRRCSGSPRLAKTLADYLSKMETQLIQLIILETNWAVIDPKIFEVLISNFKRLEMETYKSFRPGFMEFCQEAREKICEKKLDVISPNYCREKKLQNRHNKSEHNNFVVKTDVPPFRKTDVLMDYNLSVYWNNWHITDPQYSRKPLDW